MLYKNGKAIAVSFPPQKTGYKHKNSYVNQRRSAETKSMAASAYGKKAFYHAGMPMKPLTPYHPNAHRSRLPTPTVVMPYRNASNIVIGDRTSDFKPNYPRYPRHSLKDATTNGGILATRTKWFHSRNDA